MSEKIKQEFKEYIRVLSNEICKEVLLEELKKISASFTTTNTNYNTLYTKYDASVKEIRKEVSTIHETNNKLTSFIDTVDSNSKKIDSGLKLINGEYKNVIESLMTDNNKLLSEYSEKVQSLNEHQRKIFMTELIKNINIQTEQLSESIKDTINLDKIQAIITNTKIINDKLEKIQNNIRAVNSQCKMQVQSTDVLKNKMLDMRIGIVNDVGEQYSQLEKHVKYLENTTNSLMNEIKDQNKRIKTMVIVTLTINILILLIK